MATRTFYALVDGCVRLVRIETANGELERGFYGPYLVSGWFGPLPPCLAPDEWEHELRSGDRARILSALEWLGASHTGPDDDPQSAGTGDPATDLEWRWTETKHRPLVEALVLRLGDSRDAWIREAARAVVGAKK